MKGQYSQLSCVLILFLHFCSMIEREITYAIWAIMCKNIGKKIKIWRIFQSFFSYTVWSLTIHSTFSLPSDVSILLWVRLQKVHFHWLLTMGQHLLLTDFLSMIGHLYMIFHYFHVFWFHPCCPGLFWFLLWTGLS